MINIDAVKLKDLLPMQYLATVDLPENPGESVVGTVVINRRDFLMQGLKHAVMGDDGSDPEQYQIDWSVQNDFRYWKGDQAPMAGFFGSVKHGRWAEISPPVPLEQQTTLFVKLTNRYPSGGTARRVQILFGGVELREGEAG